MAIKPVSSSEEQLLALCQQTCTDLRTKYVCMNDHIPQTQIPRPLPCDHASQSLYFEKYGNRWVRLIAHVARRELVGSACDTVLATSSEWQWDHSVLIARTKTGIAECQQITVLACKALEALFPMYIAIRSMNPQDSIAHAFALVGISSEEIVSLVETDHVTNIFELLDRLKKGVILDVSLNFVCRVSEYRQKATPLIEYVTKFKTVNICDAARTSPGSLDRALQEADKMWKIAQPLVPHSRMHPDTNLLSGFANAKVPDILSKTETLISNRFPSIQWKTKHTLKTVEWTVWTQGPEAQVKPIGEHLKSIGAPASASKVKNKEDYGVIFKDPDPLELSVLFATEQLFAVATGKLAGIITRYAE